MFLNADFVFFKLIGPVLDLGTAADLANWCTSNKCFFFFTLLDLLSLKFTDLVFSDEVADLPLPDPLLPGLFFADDAADIRLSSTISESCHSSCGWMVGVVMTC